MKNLLAVFSAFLALSLAGCASDRSARLYRDAYEAYQRNELEKAESVISQILYRDNRFVDAYILRSVINQANDKGDLAVGDLSIALSIDKDNYLAHFDLGNIYYMRGKYREAIEQYSFSISARKDFANAYLNRANTYMELREYKRALSDYRAFSGMSGIKPAGVDRMIKLLEKDAAP